MVTTWRAGQLLLLCPSASSVVAAAAAAAAAAAGFSWHLRVRHHPSVPQVLPLLEMQKRHRGGNSGAPKRKGACGCGGCGACSWCMVLVSSEDVATPTSARRPGGDDDPAGGLACGLFAGFLIWLGDLAAGWRLCRLLGGLLGRKESSDNEGRLLRHQQGVLF